MKISIIIPIYMVSEYIEECILSALNQTFKNLEIICINDATKDDSFLKAINIINNHQRKGIVKTIIHKENKGLSAARNSGIKASAGDFLFFLDSDDTLPLNAIETLSKYINNNKIDCVIGNYDRRCLSINQDKTYCSDANIITLNNNNIANSLFAKKFDIMACNKLINRNVFFKKNNWFYEGLLHEDILWSFNLSLNIKKVIIIPYITYHYRIRANSITQKKKERNFECLVFINSQIERKSRKLNSKKFPLFYDFSLNLKIYILKELVRANFNISYYNKIRKSISNSIHLKSYIHNISFNRFLILLIIFLPGIISKTLISLLILRNNESPK